MPRHKRSPIQTNKDNINKNKNFPVRLLGMKDFVALDDRYFDYIVDKARDYSRFYNFTPIKVPILESYELYKKSTRRDTGKEFYGIEGLKSEKAILRPELTQGMIRAYLENNLGEDNAVVRLFSWGSIFRPEKLQSGHYRESVQADFEIIGDDKPLTEALLIALVHNFFNDLQINNQVQINSIGSEECRKEYCHKLLAFYKERGRRSKLCRYCRNNLNKKNCIGLLDCKEESCQKLATEAPQIADYLSVESREHFTKTLEFLDELKIDYNFNPYLVRGLNYYNGVVFEFWPAKDDGTAISKLALAAGGRYDSLVEKLGGESVSALGVAIGVERTLAKIKNKSLLINSVEEDIVFIAQLGEQAKLKAMQLFVELEQEGFNVRQSFASNSLKDQLEDAVKAKAKTCLILGKKEIMDGTILLRDIESGAQETVVFKKVKDRLARRSKLINKKVNNRKGGVLYGRL